MFAELMAFFAALREISSTLKLLVEEVKKLRQDSINSAIDNMRKDVNETLKKIQDAKTNEDRRILSLELANRMSK